MKKYIFTLVTKTMAAGLCAFTFLLPLSAHAEIKAGSLEASPFIGYNLFERKQNLEDRPVMGGRIGYNVTNRFGLEGTLEYMKSRVDDDTQTATREGQFASPDDNVRITSYHLDFLYHFMPERNLNPFIVAGFGATHYSPEISDGDMSAVNFGVGAKYWLADRLALRFDLRDNMVSELFKHNYHNVSATAGLVFSFGGQSKVKPPLTAATAPAPAPAVVKSELKPAEEVVIVVAEEPAGDPQARSWCNASCEKVVIVVAEEPAPQVEEKVKILAAESKVKKKVIILAFEDIHFDFSESTLNAEAKRVLRNSIQILKENPNAKVRIAGYTSASGTKEYNQTLSEQRADSVQAFLTQEGIIAPERLSTIGHGQTRPAEYEAAPDDIYSNAAKANMRVLFEILVE